MLRTPNEGERRVPMGKLSPETPEERAEKARITPEVIARARGFVEKMRAPAEYRYGKVIKRIRALDWKRLFNAASSNGHSNGNGSKDSVG